jgi:hypothetical protein
MDGKAPVNANADALDATPKPSHATYQVTYHQIVKQGVLNHFKGHLVLPVREALFG